MHSEDSRGKYLCGAVQRIVERSQGKKIHTKIKKNTEITWTQYTVLSTKILLHPAQRRIKFTDL